MLFARVKDGKVVTFIKVNNASDWNLHSMVKSYYFFKLWKESDVDFLGVVSYAA